MTLSQVVAVRPLPVAAQAVRWPGIPRVARSRLTECSKSVSAAAH